jgi:protein-arginine kinase activator protein McsA
LYEDLEDVELCEWCQQNDAVGLFSLDDMETGLCATCATDNDAERCE